MMPKFTHALLLSLSLGAPAMAADHRDAPTIDDYSAIDINDVYMFRDPSGCNPASAGCNLVMVLSTQAVADPSFGPSYHFQPNALYRFNFSTTPDAITKGIPTESIDFVFSPFDNSSAECPAPSPPCQTYRAFFPHGAVIEGLTTQGTAKATPAPINVREVPVQGGGSIKIFAGPREDPFFFDLVGFNRFIADFNSQPAPAVPHFNLFTGKDAFKGKNINAIVMEFPFSVLLRPGQTKLAAWAVTYLGDLRNDEDTRGDLRHDDHGKHLGELRQVDRMGNPGVNTVLISTPLKDAFNFGEPRHDAKDFAPTIAGNLIRYGVDQANVLPALATAAIPDTLKFDASLPDGYLQVPPNGRQLTDRTTDFLLTLFFNVKVPTHATSPCTVAQTNFSDCTEAKVPLATFPFAGPPLQPTP